MDKYTAEDYRKAAEVISSYGEEYPKDLQLTTEQQLKAYVKAFRTMLRVPEGGSTIERLATVIRRHDDMSKKLGKPWHLLNG